MEFEPKIIAFCCNWCSYGAADLAGISRMHYPAGIPIIRVMCTGMIHPEMILAGLNQGADGIMILGCHLGRCHYLDGNYKALSRSETIAEIIEDFGYEQERFQFGWVSSTEPDKFVALVMEMSERLKLIGPNSMGTALNRF